MQKYLVTILIFGFGGYLLSCSSSQQYSAKTPATQTTPSKYYTTAFPARSVSDQLNKAQEAILRIISTGYYNIYNFKKNYITLADIRTNNPEDLATDMFSTEESTAGSSIILDANRENALAITCNHVVSFPDTIVTYYENENRRPNTYVKSISIKDRQVNLIFGPREFHNFEIIASDSHSDLALLNAPIDRNELDQHRLRFPMGNSDFLQTGSFLYIFGFPKGYSIVTRGLASTSEDWSTRFFVTDALFNPGISGGLIIGSNDNFKTFQWVGMARSATASTEAILVPRPDSEKYGKAIQPYRDSTFVQEKIRISYGLTQAIPVNQIRDFLKENQRVVRRNGFSYPGN